MGAGWPSSQSQGGVSGGRQGREGLSTVHRRKPGSLAGTCVLGNLSSPLYVRNTALGFTQEHAGPDCSLCLECPSPSIYLAVRGSSITSSVKLSLTSTVACASTLLPEPYLLVTTLSVPLVLL